MGNQRIGTLTFHIAHNYGAMLQAYALPIALRKCGYHCEVIDYRFPYIDRWSRIKHLSDYVAQFGAVGGGLRYMKRLASGYYFRDNMHIRFDRFERKIIPHSKTVYRSKAALQHLPYDAIIFGSDQIWNSAITNGIADEYIGGFPCHAETKKIAYAASCGTSDFQPESKALYTARLKDFHAISVREKGLQQTLCSRGFQASCVLDPTLLLTEADWRRIIPSKSNRSSNKYLLIYAFDEDEKLYDLARDYAKKHGLEIIAIAYKPKACMHGINVLTNCGPLEFLSLVSNAEHVITTSFHGTVFSVTFQKNFHCIPHPKYRERTDSLLEMLGLMNHNVDKLSSLEDIETNWESVNQILAHERTASINFLETALNSKA